MKTTPSTSGLICSGKCLDLASPKVAGILNVTPDSFFDGGAFENEQTGLSRIEDMASQGADIIDIGGESTRPGAAPVTVNTELSRVMPILGKAVGRFPHLLFSIDTTKYDVAKAALDAGAHIVNDVSGLRKEPRLAALCAEYGAGYILMHSQGDPGTMQINPEYEDVVLEIREFFKRQTKILNEAGAFPVILDPGIGFGKLLSHNLEILANLDQISDSGYPLMVGASRKSVIGQILEGRPAEGRLAGTIAMHYHSLMMGAGILRVHDVREAVDSVKIFNSIRSLAH